MCVAVDGRLLLLCARVSGSSVAPTSVRTVAGCFGRCASARYFLWQLDWHIVQIPSSGCCIGRARWVWLSCALSPRVPYPAMFRAIG